MSSEQESSVGSESTPASPADNNREEEEQDQEMKSESGSDLSEAEAEGEGGEEEDESSPVSPSTTNDKESNVNSPQGKIMYLIVSIVYRLIRERRTDYRLKLDLDSRQTKSCLRLVEYLIYAQTGGAFCGGF